MKLLLPIVALLVAGVAQAGSDYDAFHAAQSKWLDDCWAVQDTISHRPTSIKVTREMIEDCGSGDRRRALDVTYQQFLRSTPETGRPVLWDIDARFKEAMMAPLTKRDSTRAAFEGAWARFGH